MHRIYRTIASLVHQIVDPSYYRATSLRVIFFKIVQCFTGKSDPSHYLSIMIWAYFFIHLPIECTNWLPPPPLSTERYNWFWSLILLIRIDMIAFGIFLIHLLWRIQTTQSTSFPSFTERVRGCRLRVLSPTPTTSPAWTAPPPPWGPSSLSLIHWLSYNYKLQTPAIYLKFPSPLITSFSTVKSSILPTLRPDFFLDQQMSSLIPLGCQKHTITSPPPPLPTTPFLCPCILLIMVG